MRAVLWILVLATSASAVPGGDEIARAKEHYRLGTQLYDLGKYLEAADEYQQAFKLSDRPEFLFNIGQACRLGGKAKEAVFAYQGFLRRVPDAAERDEVAQHIDQLNRKIREDEAQAAAERAAAQRASEERAAAERARAERERAAVEKRPTDAVAPPKPELRRRIYKRWWLWTLVGAGVVAVGVGVGVGIGLPPKANGGTLGVIGPNALTVRF